MKILFIILFLISSSVANASIINFKDCGTNSPQIDKDIYEQYRFEIDLKKKIVKNLQILTDKELKRQKVELNKILNSDTASKDDKILARSLFGFPKILKIEYIIDYEDKNYITAKGVDNDFNSGELETNITIYLKEKSVHSKSEFVKKNRTKIALSADGVKFFCK